MSDEQPQCREAAGQCAEGEDSNFPSREPYGVVRLSHVAPVCFGRLERRDARAQSSKPKLRIGFVQELARATFGFRRVA